MVQVILANTQEPPVNGRPPASSLRSTAEAGEVQWRDLPIDFRS